MQHPVLFLDDGGVMSDNQRRGEQWRPLVARFFSPRLGGSPEAWEAANFKVITEILTHEAWQVRLKTAPDYATFERNYFVDWLHAMCDLVGVAAPGDEESLALSKQATRWIIPQVRAWHPGAPEAIRALHGRGYKISTASGEPSIDLAGYLHGMGVLDCFDRLYGPDLIDVFKAGPEFYERLLADSRVDPSNAIFVDDSPLAAAWATQAGARAVLVGPAPSGQDGHAIAHIPALADLPGLLE